MLERLLHTKGADQEDPLERECSTPVLLPGKSIPWTGSLMGYSPRGVAKSQTQRSDSTATESAGSRVLELWDIITKERRPPAPLRGEKEVAPPRSPALHPAHQTSGWGKVPLQQRKDSVAEEGWAASPTLLTVGRSWPKEGRRPTQGHIASQKQS